jgi:hypothetical protein
VIAAEADFSNELVGVRQQGRRNTCLAFATTAAHERFGKHQSALSVEYLYYRAVENAQGWTPSDGVAINEISEALTNHGQPVEAAWPYITEHPDPWVLPTIDAPFHSASMFGGAMTLTEIGLVLSKGVPVILGLLITRGFATPGDAGEIDYLVGDPEIGGHAVLAVGYGSKVGGSRYLLVRNSWGTEWGLMGHAWVSEQYVEHHLHETALVGEEVS